MRSPETKIPRSRLITKNNGGQVDAVLLFCTTHDFDGMYVDGIAKPHQSPLSANSLFGSAFDQIRKMSGK